MGLSSLINKPWAGREEGREGGREDEGEETPRSVMDPAGKEAPQRRDYPFLFAPLLISTARFNFQNPSSGGGGGGGVGWLRLACLIFSPLTLTLPAIPVSLFLFLSSS